MQIGSSDRLSGVRRRHRPVVLVALFLLVLGIAVIIGAWVGMSDLRINARDHE